MTTDITDADLTAYLDGEADAALTARIDAALTQDDELAARFAELSVDTSLLAEAFDLDRLAPPAYVPVEIPQAQSGPSRLVLPLAIAASFALGAIAVQFVRPAAPTWVDAVASYQALYVTETLSGTMQAPAISEGVFETVDETLGVDLRPAKDIEGLMFRRAQMLAIEGKPLVQMAYLDDQGRPFAFCAVLLGDGDEAILSEMNHGLAAASWVEDGVGYVLIGGDDVPGVTALSRALQQTL